MNKLIIPAALTLTACGIIENEHEPPNILWISHEDLSPIYGCYGDEYAHTPNLDKFAETAIMFTNASSNAPICAPARSTLITGMYATSLGTQHLRSDIPLPDDMKILPEVLREAGYYTTNNVKTDYNFSHEGRWDESSREAHWRNRNEGQPFFSVFNFMITHEGPINRLDTNDTKGLAQHHDPNLATLPPYIPDSPKMRKIWAHKYDLLSVFDQEVGKLLDQLKEDGLYENTIVFIFSDHGTGLPGHKRWLNNAGLQVPFLLHVPEKYRHWIKNLEAPVTDQLVAFVDFAPTVITLAGAEVPEIMEGHTFLGKNAEPKQYTFGYRDRADDCYEMSRSVFDGRYLYVRHFMPQLPYFQDAIIFGPSKQGSYEEIHRLKALDSLPPATMAWFGAKPAEQLFDLNNDPFEQSNLINDPLHAGRIAEMNQQLHQWMLDFYDTGLINEGEYMEMAHLRNTSVYEAVRQLPREKMEEILQAAEMVGKTNDMADFTEALKSPNSTVRYWALVGLDEWDGDLEALQPQLLALLKDPSYSVATMAAEILVKRFDNEEGLQTLGKILKTGNEPVVLQAAISLRRTGTKAAPLLPAIDNEIMPEYAGTVWNRYRSWSYPMFIGMALDQTQINCGREIKVR
jgi:N-sulfoglucosamine sulfohydrolase